MTIQAVSRLVKPNELKKLFDLNKVFTDNFRVLEANVGAGAKRLYDSGHINTAVYIDTLKCTEPSQMYPRPLPDYDCFKDYVGNLGISNKHHLIIYDRTPFGFYASTRMWSIFKMLGQEKVSIIDGGLNNLIKHGYELSTDIPEFKKEVFTINENKNASRDFEQIINRKGELLLDSRGDNAFKSEHIPGSKNIPYDNLFDESTGLMKTKEQLLKLFKEKNIDLSKNLVASCQTGMTATSLAFALEIIGIKDVPVYYGSWSEYQLRKNES